MVYLVGELAAALQKGWDARSLGQQVEDSPQGEGSGEPGPWDLLSLVGQGCWALFPCIWGALL